MKAQALERDGKQNNVTVFGDFSLGLPNGIKAEVVVVNAFSGNSIQLDTQRIGKKFIGALAVMKCIQRDAHGVVAGNVFPLYHVGAQLVRISFADKSYIKIAIVIRDVSGCIQAGGSAVMRLTLQKFSDLEAGRLGVFVEIVFQ